MITHHMQDKEIDLTITQRPLFGNYHADAAYLAGISPEKDFVFLNIQQENLSIPLIKRRLNQDFYDLFSPIGFQPCVKQALWPVLLESTKVNLVPLGVVSLYILSRNDLSGIAPSHGIDLSLDRTNYYIDLRLSDDEWLAQQKSDSRQRLKKAIHTKSVEVKEARVSKDFISHYHRIAGAKNFSHTYVFSEADFNRIDSARNVVYLELRDAKDFIAGGLFGCDRADVDYLFGADSPIHRDAIRVLIYEARKYFKERRFDRLYLGGGIREDDSLAVFKQRMGTIGQRCSAIRAVINVGQSEKFFGAKFSSEWFNGFFPPYARKRNVG